MAVTASLMTAPPEMKLNPTYTAAETAPIAIVDWVEAGAEVSTMSNNKWVSTVPIQPSPNTAVPTVDNTSPTFSGFASPIPSVPTPAKAWLATVSNVYTATSSTVASTAARPGVMALSLVSSLIDTLESHPQ